MSQPASANKLRRGVSLTGLTAYGIGGMLGGGIYALVGAVAAKAGSLAWLSFALAMLVAAPTAISYLVFSSRYPRSGGEAHYVQQAFGKPRLSMLVGWLVALSGLVSMATLSVAFASFAHAIVPGAPRSAIVAAFLIGLCAINLRGIRFTSGINIVCTAVEVSGLVIVIIAGATALFGAGAVATDTTAVATAVATDEVTGWGAVQGALLAFYAFIGFEDMVNIAEEVQRPRRAYRVAIPVALLVVSAVYMAVAALATATVPLAVLTSSSTPLGEVVSRGLPALPDHLFNIIALFAVANSALLNCVMASRLLYGMADEGLLPRWFAAVNQRFATPHHAIAVVLTLALALALTGSLTFLAGTTGLILLLVFVVVNSALFAVLGRAKDGGIAVPRAVPLIGALLALAMTATAHWTSMAVAGAAVVIGGALGLLHRPSAPGSRAPTGTAPSAR